MAHSRLRHAFSLLLICLFWQLASVNSVHFYSDKNKLQFITEPESALTAADDRRVTFKCVVSPSEASIKWLLNGTLISNTTHDWIKITQNKLVIKLQKNTQFGDSIHESLKSLGDVMDLQGSVFQCLAELNKQVIVSQPAKLIIAELQSFDDHQESQNISIITGNSAIIPCKLPRSVPLAVAEFEFNNSTISYSTDRYRILPSGDMLIINVRLSDSGIYRCIAHNPFLREKLYANHFIYLKIVKPKHASASLKNLKFISKPKEHISAIIGSNITMECVVNGFPVAKISWTKINGEISKTRAFVDNGNLIISTIQKNDEGTYTCTASNNRSTLTADSELQVYEMPQIVDEAYESVQLHEGQEGHLICNAKGKPRPIISWLHNGYFVDSQTTKDFSFEKDNAVLRIASANAAIHQGIFQCFATNELGSTYSIKSVFIKPFHGDFSSNFTNPYFTKNPNDNHDTHGTFENIENSDANHNYDNVEGMAGGGRHKKKPKISLELIPPSKPEISKLNDDSVMVRWSVPKSTGLPISFFKVQYRQDRKPWHTLDVDIPPYIFSYSVCCLQINSTYRFRIAAVYANDDNMNGKSSKSFILQKETKIKMPIYSPTILNASSFSSTEIGVEWEFLNLERVPIDGFLVYYRPADTAGEYFMITSMGENVRQYNISHLQPNTAYEIKMQCFNQAGTSQFSNIYTIKTQGNGSKVEPPPVESTDAVDPPVLETDNKIQMLAIVVSIFIILGVIICFVFCITRPRTQAPSSKVVKKDKPLKHPSDYYFTSANVNNLYDKRANGNLLKGTTNSNNNNNTNNSNGCVASNHSENESTPMNNPLQNSINEAPSLSRKNSLRSAMSYSTHQLYGSSNNFKTQQNQESTATIDRRRSMKNVANMYLDGTKLNHHSASFTRLNGTLERKRRSRPDLSTLERPYTRNLTHGSEAHPNGNVNYFPLNGPIVIMQSSC